MGHLPFAAIVFDPTGDDPFLAHRELPLQPAPIGSEEGERQKAGSVIKLHAVRRLFVIGRVIGVDLTFHRRDFSEFCCLD